MPFLDTSASRSNFVPTSSLFFSPIQTMAGLSAVNRGGMTVTVKKQLEVSPPESVAVQITSVVLFAKTEPVGGEQATETPEQLSIAVTL